MNGFKYLHAQRQQERHTHREKDKVGAMQIRFYYSNNKHKTQN